MSEQVKFDNGEGHGMYVVLLTEHARRYRVLEIAAASPEDAEEIASEIYENEGSDGWEEGELLKLDTKVVGTIDLTTTE